MKTENKKSGENKLFLFDIESFKLLAKADPPHAITALAFADNHTIVAGLKNGQVVVVRTNG